MPWLTSYIPSITTGTAILPFLSLEFSLSLVTLPTAKMASQNHQSDQFRQLAEFHFENIDPLAPDGGDQFNDIDFVSFPLPEFSQYEISSLPVENSLDPVTGDVSTVLDANPELTLSAPDSQFDDGYNYPLPEMPVTAPSSQIYPPREFLPDNSNVMSNHALAVGRQDQQILVFSPRQDLTCSTPASYSQPRARQGYIRAYDRQPIYHQDHTSGRYRLTRHHPAVPQNFMPYIDVQHPPRRESEVHDVKGCKDTTIANDYYYRIKSLAPLKNMAVDQPDLIYQGPEFHPSVEFTGSSFLSYLRTSERTPVLIIQMQPQKRNHRYIRGGHSFKCRNKDCPDPRKTIWKGHFRVCITEFFDDEGLWVNPFQSAAGYLHLYCLENMLNLIELVVDNPVLVCPEVRNFQHEPDNPMELGKLEQRAYERWLHEIAPTWTRFRDKHLKRKTPRDQWPAFQLAEDDRLYHRLTAAHLKKNHATVEMAKKRRAQSGHTKLTAHVDQYMGDVGKHVAVMKRRRTAHTAGGGKRSSPIQDTAHVDQYSSDVDKPAVKRRRTAYAAKEDGDSITVRVEPPVYLENTQSYHPDVLQDMPNHLNALDPLISQTQAMLPTSLPSAQLTSITSSIDDPSYINTNGISQADDGELTEFLALIDPALLQPEEIRHLAHQYKEALVDQPKQSSPSRRESKRLSVSEDDLDAFLESLEKTE